MSILIGQIKIDGIENISHLNHLDIDIKPNHHATGYIKMTAASENDIIRNIDNKITVSYRTKDIKKIIYCGLIQRIQKTCNNGSTQLELWLASGTCKLDQKKRRKSFQNIKKSYSEVVREVLSNENGDVIFTCHKHELQPIDVLIQYDETDWEFLKRIASHFHTSVVPSCISGNPELYFGLDLNGSEVTIPEPYQTIFSKKYYDTVGERKFMKYDFLSYKAKSYHNYDVGDYTYINGIRRQIYRKHIISSHGQLEFEYELGHENLYSTQKQYNQKLKGVMLNGTVIEAKDELVSVKLDINPEETDITKFFEWTPLTGNSFYGMPEKGERVALRFENQDESSAKAVKSIRSDCSSEALENSSHRFFTTPYQKSIHLETESLSVNTMGNHVIMSDQTGISVSGTSLQINADANIRLEGERIKAYVPLQISLIRNGNVSMSTLNMCNQFDISGKVGQMTGTSETFEEKNEESSNNQKAVINSEVYHRAAISAIPTGSGGKGIIGSALASIVQDK